MQSSQIQIFTSEDGEAQLEVTLDQETVWLSLDQMVVLFDRDKSVISRHIRNLFKDGELVRNSVVAKNATTAADGKTYQVNFYNLDVVISQFQPCYAIPPVGYPNTGIRPPIPSILPC